MQNIVFIDSGNGGKNILKACKQLLPKHNFIYISDTKNAPYGNKNPKELFLIAKNLIEMIIEKFNPKIVVIACNTLTTNCIQKLRDSFRNLVFVGTEPALAPALKKYKPSELLLFSTRATNKKCKLKIKKISIKNLPKMIDENINDLEKLDNLLKKHFKIKKYSKIKAIVLGCTHYSLIDKMIHDMAKRVLQCEIKLFDGKYGVARHLKKVLEENGLINENGSANVQYVVTGDEKELNVFKKYMSV